ncbi:MAG TPA: cardiolipin synthase ClsB, partial [Burkholderiaceae bacterium]
WATVGSSNIDPLSLLLNLEANVMVRDADFCAALSREIDAAFAASREVTAAETGGRLDALRRTFVAWVARIFLRVAGATGRY